MRGNRIVLSRGCWGPIPLILPQQKPVVYTLHQVSLNMKAVNFLNLLPTLTSPPMFFSFGTDDWKLTLFIKSVWRCFRTGMALQSLAPHTVFLAKWLTFDLGTKQRSSRLEQVCQLLYYMRCSLFSWSLKWTIRYQSGIYNVCSDSHLVLISLAMVISLIHAYFKSLLMPV